MGAIHVFINPFTRSTGLPDFAIHRRVCAIHAQQLQSNMAGTGTVLVEKGKLLASICICKDSSQ
jgi:hypothetical protein